MAKATKAIIAAVDSREARERVAQANLATKAAERADSLERWIELAALVERSGLLDLAEAILRKGEDLLEQAVERVSQPSGQSALKNVLRMAQVLGDTDPEVLDRALRTGSKALDGAFSAAERRPVTGLLDLWQSLRDPEVGRGLRMVLEALKAIGANAP